MEPIHLDDDCWKILKTLTYAPKTPQIISHVYGMPISDCWKRIRFLEGLGLIRVVLAFFSKTGRVLYFYQTAQDRLDIVYEGTPQVYFQPVW